MFGKYLHALNVAQAAGLFKACLKEPQACFGRAQAQSKNLVLIYQNKVPDICSYSFSILFSHFEAINSATRTCQHCFVVFELLRLSPKMEEVLTKRWQNIEKWRQARFGVKSGVPTWGCLWMFVDAGQ